MSYFEEKRFRWFWENFSELQDTICYSRTFLTAGCKWRLRGSYKEGTKGNVYLELVDTASFPLGWRKEVKFHLTLVNKIRIQPNRELEAQCWFDAKHRCWGLKDLLPLDVLDPKGNEFLLRDRVVIVAEVQILQDIIVAEDPAKTTETLTSKEGNQDTDAFDERDDDPSQEDLDNDDAAQEDLDDDGASQEALEDDDASQEALDDDDASQEALDDGDAAQEDLDDDGSSHVSDEGGQDSVKITKPSSSKEGDQATDANDETSQEDLDDDDASDEDLDDDKGSAHVSDDEVPNADNEDAPNMIDVNGTVEVNQDDDASSLNRLKSMVDTTKTIENGGTGCNNKASIFETSNSLTKELRPAKQTVDVKGFQVLISQALSVSHIFRRHPDTALVFRPKNQQIRRAYMDELLRLIETLCQSPEKLSDDDLSSADETLVDLIDAGFKLDWLKTKLNEVSEKKKIEKNSVATLQTMEEQLQKLKNMVLDIESQLQKEKAKALAARTPLSFKDVVC